MPRRLRTSSPSWRAAGLTRAGEFVPWLAGLKRDIGIPPSLSAAGVQRSQFSRLVDLALKDVCHQTNRGRARRLRTLLRASVLMKRPTIGISACFFRRSTAADFHRQDAAVRRQSIVIGAVVQRAGTGDPIARGTDAAATSPA
jgi:hypothetical protein